MKTSPTQRSMAHMREQGYYAEKVERINTWAKTKNDLLGFVDVLCIHRESGDVVAVQSTSASNVSARINKITTHENLPLARKAGWTVLVHGWAKRKGRWVLREENLS